MKKGEDFKVGLRRRYLAVYDEVFEELSREKGITHKEFCEMIGLRRASVNNFRDGTRTPGVEDIMNLCDKFGYDIGYVIRGKDKPAGKVPAEGVTLEGIYELLKEIRAKL
ncbi:Helix-turn-helix domain-containing protein [Chitinophaga eiseniae]|uniref:Helix-turn-helix domain-containing protein n=1 Tax=Chitinophaga eiseniae TaxID=634771 RepID=A0A1T4SP30_9BACT|nr:Helix-turn-helix domain-containing protein [Chitinophaga eiseniae]